MRFPALKTVVLAVGLFGISPAFAQTPSPASQTTPPKMPYWERVGLEIFRKGEDFRTVEQMKTALIDKEVCGRIIIPKSDEMCALAVVAAVGPDGAPLANAGRLLRIPSREPLGRAGRLALPGDPCGRQGRGPRAPTAV